MFFCLNDILTRKNNLVKEHGIPLGALVECEFSQRDNQGVGCSGKAKLYVIAHDRDFMGLPIYALAAEPIIYEATEIWWLVVKFALFGYCESALTYTGIKVNLTTLSEWLP